MKKRFLLAAVMAMCMMVMVMPAAFAEGEGTTSQPTAGGNAFFANGTPITISAEAPANATQVTFENVTASETGIINSYISWTNSDGQLVYYAAPDTLAFIFGGSNGHTTPVSVASTSITMTGGKITNLYGGNYGAQSKEEGKSSTVVGDVTISLSGDAVVDYVLYGGGRYNTSVQGTVTMTFDGVDLSSANTDSCYVNGGVHGDGNEGTRNIEAGTMTTDAVVNKVVITAADSKFYLLGGGGGGSTKVNDSDVTLTNCEAEYLYLSGINGEVVESTITLNNSKVGSYSATNRGFVGTGTVNINASTIGKLSTGAADGCFSSDSGSADGSGVTGSVVYNIDQDSTVETAVLTPYVSRNASGYTANFQNVTINNQAAPLELSIDSFVAVYDGSGNATKTLTEFQVPTGSKLDLNNVQTTVSTGQTLTNAGTIDMDEASKMTVAAGAKLEDNTDGSGITGTVVKEYAAQIGEIGYDSLQEAVENAKADDVITLLQNVEITSTITIPADVTLDGDGKSITYTGTDTSGAFLTAEKDSNNVAIKNITINANNITHGVQFYCNGGGSLENVIINGGTGTSVIVNGATNVTIKDSQLNPKEGYATIEYGMGGGVTTVPTFTLNNVTTSDSNGIVVWADNNTVQRVIDNSSGTVTTENVADVITGNITTINNDSITIAIGVESGNPPEVIETPSTKPVVSNPTYTITNPAVTGGTVTVSPRSASRGRLVTITVTPDEGYELASLTVTDSRGNTVTLTDAGNGKYTFTMPGSRVVVNAAFQLASLPFTDVAEGAWYYDAVAYVYRNGLMAGVSSTQFAPDSTLNRATLATILWRLAGEPVVNYVLPFEDVAEGEWYSEAVRWAASTGIVNGTTPTTFRPFNSVTREQMAAMVHRYAEYMGYDTTATTDLDTFTDAASVNSYAAEPMGWCVAEGLISGIGTEIRPQSSATRAQIATMLMRFCENIAK